MIDPLTVSEAFIAWLEDRGYGTFGDNIYLNKSPLSAPSDSWTVITDGGQPVTWLVTGEIEKTYLIQVRYKNVSNKVVDRTLFKLEEELNSRYNLYLDGFDVRRVSTSQFASSQDIDNEELQTGLLAVNVQLYRAPNDAPNMES